MSFQFELYTIKTKKILFAFAALIIVAACGNKQVVAPAEGDEVNNEVGEAQSMDYYAAIDRYLAEQIAGQYAKGEYSVPVYQEVAVDDGDSTDIRIWGDFWVYNYKQVGDTLKCVSGGNHPGLMIARSEERRVG